MRLIKIVFYNLCIIILLSTKPYAANISLDLYPVLNANKISSILSSIGHDEGLAAELEPEMLNLKTLSAKTPILTDPKSLTLAPEKAQTTLDKFNKFSIFNTIPRSLKVGIIISEPWVMYDKSIVPQLRNPRGFSIDLWREIATSLGVKTIWVYFNSLPELLEAVKNNEVDLAISAITVILEREQYLDFSNSMYETGLKIMTLREQSSSFKTIREVVTLLFFNKNIFYAILVIFVVSNAMWLADRIDKSNRFPHEYKKGFIPTLRWVITILLAYGRLSLSGWSWVVDLIWMLISRTLFVVITGVIAAALATNAVKGSINTLEDLKNTSTGVVKNSAPSSFMKKHSVNLKEFFSFQECIDALLSGEITAFVHDGPRLSYWAEIINNREEGPKVRIAPRYFNSQNYGIVLPDKSILTEFINRELQRLRESTNSNEKSLHRQMQDKWLPYEQ